MKPKGDGFLKDKIFKVEHHEANYGFQSLTGLLSRQCMKHIYAIEFVREKNQIMWGERPEDKRDKIQYKVKEERVMLLKVLSWICENKNHFKSLSRIYITEHLWLATKTYSGFDEIQKAVKLENISY